MNTPILILCWRRPETLRQVLHALRPLGPTSLFVACDGPNINFPEQVANVEATRTVIEDEIDWPCKIERLYSDDNQGCRLGVSRAITWFFDNVEEGIILEDDCVPHPDFFSYCTSLLEHYRYDTRVWCISGNNFQDSKWLGDGDYFFSQIPMCWGWATWRTRWIYYDSELQKWPAVKRMNLLKYLIADPVMSTYWSALWSRLWAINKPDSWAYRWAFTCVVERGLTAVPKVNLVQNVGFGADATHTTSSRFVRPSSSLSSTALSHPTFICSLPGNDISIFNNHFGGMWMRFPLNFLRIPLRIFLKLRKLF